ncbi:extracellular solute-binding protein [Candidatus Aerophobetes bacterium]|nr:extracellular solute-binding protein [Candidatus Aerophobetes bacterium]
MLTKNSKKVLKYVGLCCIVILLFGQFVYGAEKPQFKGTTITVMAIAEAYARGFKMFEDEIAQKYGIKMKFDMTPPQDAYSKAMLQFATGRSSWDIVLFMPANLADYSKHLEPLEPLIKKLGLNFYLDDIMPVYRDIYCSWEGTLYAIPWDGDQHNLYYNKEAFAEYGLTPPTTWDEYDKIAELLNGKDWDHDGKREYGVVEAWQRGGYAFWWWMDRFASYGGIYFDEEMNPLLNSAGGIKALEHMVNITPFVPPGTLTFGYPECENAFIKSDAPMVVQWASTGKSAMDPTASLIVGKVGVALIPGVIIRGKLFRRTTLPTGWSAGIPKYAQHKEAAALVLEYLSQPDRALKICVDPKTFVDPWRVSSFNLTKWLSLWPGYESYTEDYLKVMKKTIELGLPDLQIPGSDAYVKAADAEISAALIGKKSPKKALDDAVKAWNKITDRYGREQQKEYWKAQYTAMQEKEIVYIPYEK